MKIGSLVKLKSDNKESGSPTMVYQGIVKVRVFGNSEIEEKFHRCTWWNSDNKSFDHLDLNKTSVLEEINE